MTFANADQRDMFKDLKWMPGIWIVRVNAVGYNAAHEKFFTPEEREYISALLDRVDRECDLMFSDLSEDDYDQG